MGFYYFSLIGCFLVLAAGAIVAGTFWLVWAKILGRKLTPRAIAISLPIAFLIPWSEEFWIAWNFGQACKSAGTFVHRTVEVDGFYDDTRTTHAGIPTAQAAKSFDDMGYQFLEMRGREKYVRLDKTENGWIASAIDLPSSRYHYRSAIHVPYSYRVVRHEYQIVDSTRKEPLAQEIKYGRYAPWFFVSADSPIMICAGTRSIRGSLYQTVLVPAKKQKGP